jgi:AraC-like DNA-binding protein
MSQSEIKTLIEKLADGEGMVETSVQGVQVFRITEQIRCAPAVYEPAVIALVSGTKQAILDGNKFTYDSGKYLCCSMSMPVEAGIHTATPDNPLFGAYISLNTNTMTELAFQMENNAGAVDKPKAGLLPQGVALSQWDNTFTDALLRLLQLADNPSDTSVLGAGRLREFYYAVLKGDAGASARRAFGAGNEIARAIEYLSARLHETVVIEEVAAHAGMSRAVFHRKFKQATTMSPIQFVKAMRLNTAAMKIASGMSVNEAAMQVGYVSTSQFSREFKRMYGQSPGQWSRSNPLPSSVTA